jgi:DNA repair exonuclease SbcCD ATPase subunit
MSEEFQSSKPRNSNILLWSIIALLIAAGAYFFIQKNKLSAEKEDTELRLDEVNLEKQELNKEYNAAIARLDNLTSENAQMDSLIKTQDGEIGGLREEIQEILADKNASQAELKKAKNLIAQLEDLTMKFQKQIGVLKQENIQLNENNRSLAEEKKMTQLENEDLKQKKEVLTEEKKELQETVEVGSVLSANNIAMNVINKKKNLLGREKEKSTRKAKKADLLEVNFALGVNRIIESGDETIYIAVKGPNGNIIHSKGNATGTIELAEGGKQQYTTKKVVAYTKGKNAYNIKTNCVPTDKFESGTYHVELFHKGYLIGKDDITLK